MNVIRHTGRIIAVDATSRKLLGTWVRGEKPLGRGVDIAGHFHPWEQIAVAKSSPPVIHAALVVFVTDMDGLPPLAPIDQPFNKCEKMPENGSIITGGTYIRV